MTEASGGEGPSPGPLDIVIPARAETAGLQACLMAILEDGEALDLEVIVVANGEDPDRTLSAARALLPRFEASGHRLQLCLSDPPGKPQALNLGDRQRRGSAVVYLDADVVLEAGTLAALARQLNQAGPILICPRFRVIAPRNWLERGFIEVWSRLPTVVGSPIGAGCYAVNVAGRRRWGEFPLLAADDAFVCSLFSRDEKAFATQGGFNLHFPPGLAMVRMLRRWDRADRRLRREQGVQVGRTGEPGPLDNVAAILRSPKMLSWLPGFLAISAARRLPWPASQSLDQAAWRPNRDQ